MVDHNVVFWTGFFAALLSVFPVAFLLLIPHMKDLHGEGYKAREKKLIEELNMVKMELHLYEHFHGKDSWDRAFRGYQEKTSERA